MQVHYITSLLAIVIFTVTSYNLQVLTMNNVLRHQVQVKNPNIKIGRNFSYVALLYYCGPHSGTTVNIEKCHEFCGGLVIGRLHILTAAHCMYINNTKIHPLRLMIRAGDYDLRVPVTNETIFKIKAIFIHQKYDKNRRVNDIALIKLKQPMTFNEFIQPIYISGLHYNIQFRLLNVITAAWGERTLDPQSNVLGYARLYISDFLNCKGSAKEKLLQFCVKGFSMKEGYLCRGDDGSGLLPLKYKEDYINLLVGIFSGTGKYDAKGQMECSDLMFFVNVSSYAQWINKNAGN